FDGAGIGSIAKGIWNIGIRSIWSPGRVGFLFTREFRPFHVAIQIKNFIYDAMGPWFRMRFGRALPEVFDSMLAGARLRWLGVLSSNLATQRGTAWNCVTGAWNAWSRGNFHLPNWILSRGARSVVPGDSGPNPQNPVVVSELDLRIARQ